ncbi:hypothetical protein [Comamonas sp. JC664]|uniref:hypothetical protein n=1 Tax=Comamonas sp. JC664 TaxID=2801917 RepID=UPI00188C1A30|nr:hypothetical protein [Comamonas sp. JC664]
MRMDGEVYSIAGFRLPKAVDSLNITLNGSDLGMGFNQPIHLSGSRNGNIIRWTVNKTFNPPIDLDGTNEVRRISGTLVTNASLVPGILNPQCGFKPCARNVILSSAPGTQLRVEGEGAFGIDWSRDVTLLQLRAMGGLAQPGLHSFHAGGNAPLCSGTEDKEVPMGVSLTGFAPSGGTRVDIESALPSGVSVPPNVLVPSGRTYASFNARVKANFTGSVNVHASSKGTFFNHMVQVLNAEECKPPSRNNPFDIRESVPDILAGCLTCGLEFIDFGIRERVLLRVRGLDMYFDGLQSVTLAQAFDVLSVNAVDMTNAGLIVGTLVPKAGEAPQAFLVSMAGGPAEPTLLGEFTPTAVTARGLVVGHQLIGGVRTAVYHDGKDVYSLPLPPATASMATAVSELGHIAGTYVQDAITRAFLMQPDASLRTLPRISSTTATVPVAVNNEGQVVAHSVNALGNVVASALIDTDDTVHVLTPPPGYTQVRATSINSRGWVTATASNATTTRGFLYTQRDGWVDLTQHVDPGASVVVTEALRITDANQAMVRGHATSGASTFYVVTLE